MGILAGAYALAGFLAVPRILRSELTRYAADHYHRALSIGAIRFNPFTLTLDAAGLSFPDTDSAPMIGARGLRIELALASLWHLAPTFRRIVLDRPFAHLVVRRDGKLNLADLQTRAARPPRPAAASHPLALYIDRLAVLGGSVTYDDHSHPTAFHTEIDPIELDVRDFRTVGTGRNAYTLDFATNGGAHFHASGALAVEPFGSHGTFTLEGFPVRTLWSYLRDRLHFVVASGVVALNGSYQLATGGSAPDLSVDLPDLTVSRLGIRPLEKPQDVLDVGRLDARNAQIDLTHHAVSVATLRLTEGLLRASLDDEGKLNLAALVPRPAPPGASTGAASAKSTPWSISVPDVEVGGTRLLAEDHAVEPAAKVALDDLSLHVRGFHSPGPAALRISIGAAVDHGGKLAVQASYALGSGAATARIALDRFNLMPLQPFLAAQSALTLRSGWLTTHLDVRRSARGVLAVKGNTDVTQLRTVDALLGRDFFKWKRLALDGMAYRSRPASLAIRRIEAVAPYARVIVTPKRKLNVFEVFAAAHPMQAETPTAKTPASRGRGPSGPAAHPVPAARTLAISIGRIAVVNGSAHYTDLWIVPHFFLAIQQLDGYLKGLSSDPRTRATVDLRGKVDRYAPISIVGTMNLFSAARFSNMKMAFNGVQLPMVTPYSARFAGYKIERGTMSADITYHLEHGELSADPHFIINQLELGERVDSPDALHMPLKFAIALLKDRHGIIDLNLPLSGSLDDPHFRIGPLILKILVNLVTKAVTSPFALLGKLVGGGDQLKNVSFAPGSAALDAASRKNLATLAKALEDRPGLRLDVPSDYSPALDRPALAEAQLDDSLAALARESSAPRAHGRGTATAAVPEASDPATRFRLLVALYRKRLGARAALPAAAIAVLKARGRKKAPVPLEPATTALQSALLADIRISDRELGRLARRRARAIQGALLGGTHIDPARLFLLSTRAAAPVGQAVRVELTLK